MSTVRRRSATARVLVSLVGALLLALGLLAPAAAHPSDPGDGKATDGVTSQFGITLPQGPQECVDGTAGCDDNATCANTAGSYDCACNAG